MVLNSLIHPSLVPLVHYSDALTTWPRHPQICGTNMSINSAALVLSNFRKCLKYRSSNNEFSSEGFHSFAFTCKSQKSVSAGYITSNEVIRAHALHLFTLWDLPMSFGPVGGLYVGCGSVVMKVM